MYIVYKYVAELFDPLNQALVGLIRAGLAVLEAKQEDGLEEVIKQLEKKVNQLLEGSTIANCSGQFQVVHTGVYAYDYV